MNNALFAYALPAVALALSSSAIPSEPRRRYHPAPKPAGYHKAKKAKRRAVKAGKRATR